MGQVLHGSATTTEAVRRAIQHSQASLRALAKRYGINQKTVAKWRRRSSVADQRTGPKDLARQCSHPRTRRSSSPFAATRSCPSTIALSALQATIPHLTRSSLHRCLQRHGISRLPDSTTTSPSGHASRPIRSAISTSIWRRSTRRKGGSTCSSPSTARPSFAFVELHEKATRRVAGDFLLHLIEAVPYKVHTVLTDNVLRSEEGWLARQQVSVREHAPAVCLSSTSIQAAPADPEELSAIANTGSSRCTRHRGPHRPQHEMSIQAGARALSTGSWFSRPHGSAERGSPTWYRPLDEGPVVVTVLMTACTTRAIWR